MKYLVLVFCLCCLIGCRISSQDVIQTAEDWTYGSSLTSVEYNHSIFENRMPISIGDSITFKVFNVQTTDAKLIVVVNKTPLSKDELHERLPSGNPNRAIMKDLRESGKPEELDVYYNFPIAPPFQLALDHYFREDKTRMEEFGISITENRIGDTVDDYTVSVSIDDYYDGYLYFDYVYIVIEIYPFVPELYHQFLISTDPYDDIEIDPDIDYDFFKKTIEDNIETEFLYYQLIN